MNKLISDAQTSALMGIMFAFVIVVPGTSLLTKSLITGYISILLIATTWLHNKSGYRRVSSSRVKVCRFGLMLWLGIGYIKKDYSDFNPKTSGIIHCFYLPFCFIEFGWLGHSENKIESVDTINPVPGPSFNRSHG